MDVEGLPPAMPLSSGSESPWGVGSSHSWYCPSHLALPCDIIPAEKGDLHAKGVCSSGFPLTEDCQRRRLLHKRDQKFPPPLQPVNGYRPPPIARVVVRSWKESFVNAIERHLRSRLFSSAFLMLFTSFSQYLFVPSCSVVHVIDAMVCMLQAVQSSSHHRHSPSWRHLLCFSIIWPSVFSPSSTPIPISAAILYHLRLLQLITHWQL